MHNYNCVCTKYFWSSKLLPVAGRPTPPAWPILKSHRSSPRKLPLRLNLQLSGLDNGGLLVVLDLAGVVTSGLDGLDDVHRLGVSNLAEDDVLAIEPAGDDGGDEELGAVARRDGRVSTFEEKIGEEGGRPTCWDQRWPWTGVRAWCACGRSSRQRTSRRRWTCHRCPGRWISFGEHDWRWIGRTYVATGEVTTLKHELGDDAVEGRARVSEALLAGAERTEVLDGLGDDVFVEDEVDAAGLLCQRIDVSSVTQLRGFGGGSGSEVRRGDGGERGGRGRMQELMMEGDD